MRDNPHLISHMSNPSTAIVWNHASLKDSWDIPLIREALVAENLRPAQFLRSLALPKLLIPHLFALLPLSECNGSNSLVCADFKMRIPTNEVAV